MLTAARYETNFVRESLRRIHIAKFTKRPVKATVKINRCFCEEIGSCLVNCFVLSRISPIQPYFLSIDDMPETERLRMSVRVTPLYTMPACQSGWLTSH